MNLTGRRDRVAWLANGALAVGLLLMALVALRSSAAVMLIRPISSRVRAANPRGARVSPTGGGGGGGLFRAS